MQPTDPPSDFTVSPETQEKIGSIARLLEELRRREKILEELHRTYTDRHEEEAAKRNELVRQLMEAIDEILG